jgi:hypothetical protein
MAGLSITRRRKAWLKGVTYGASGTGKCLFRVPKLKEIWQNGVLHGRTNPNAPYVKAVVAQARARRGQGLIGRPKPRPSLRRDSGPSRGRVF